MRQRSAKSLDRKRKIALSNRPNEIANRNEIGENQGARNQAESGIEGVAELELGQGETDSRIKATDYLKRFETKRDKRRKQLRMHNLRHRAIRRPLSYKKRVKISLPF